MTLLKVRFKGLRKRYQRDTVEIDYQALGPGLIALVGDTGGGKTSAMEVAIVSLFGRFPSKPGFYENFVGGDAFVESTWRHDDGRLFVVRALVNADRRSCERYVFVDGEAVTDGKSASFSKVIGEHFGSFEMFLASYFAAQNKAGNLLEMDRGDRKELVIKMLQLAYLEALAKRAREEAGPVREVLAGERKRHADLELLLREIPDAEAAAATARALVEDAADALEAARATERTAIERHATAKAAAERIAPLEAAERQARETLLAAERTAREADGLEAKADRARDEKLELLDRNNIGALEAASEKRHADQMAALAVRKRTLNETLAAVPDRAAAQARLDDTHVQMNQIAAEDDARQDLYAKLQDARRALGITKAQLDIARDRYEGDKARLEGTIVRLKEVPCTKHGAWIEPTTAPLSDLDSDDPRRRARALGAPSLLDLAGSCPLLADAREAKAQLTHLVEPSDVEWLAAVDAETAAKRAFDEADAKREFLNVRQAELRTVAEDARSEINRAIAAEAIPAQLTAIEQEIAAADETRAAEQQEIATLRERDAASRKVIEDEHARAVTDAQGRVVFAANELRAAKARHDAAQTALASARAEMSPAVVTERQYDAEAAERARKSAEAWVTEAEQARATADARLRSLTDQQPKLVELGARISALETDLGDLTLVDATLGKNGAQALLIDAAGPASAAIANELLALYDLRQLRIEFSTQREKVSRPGEFSEDFDIVVLEGTDRQTAESLSGGEKALIAEALSMAVAIHLAGKSGRRIRTAWRDETAGALDPRAAQAYVRMLRRMMELGGFHQVHFVSHSPEVWEAADVRLHVGAGKVSTLNVTQAAA